MPGATENYLELDEALEALRMFRDGGPAARQRHGRMPVFQSARRPPRRQGAARRLRRAGARTGRRRAALPARGGGPARLPGYPVVGTGYSYLRHFALEAGEANLRAGRVSIVGLGRGAIAYPDFARDVQMDKRKACITVSYCTTLMRAKDNELGQYAAGCVPRDPVYARLLQVIQKDAKRKAAPRRPD